MSAPVFTREDLAALAVNGARAVAELRSQLAAVTEDLEAVCARESRALDEYAKDVAAVTKQRDEARAQADRLADQLADCAATRGRLRAAIEPTEENLNAIEATVMPRALGQYRHIMRAILAAIAARAGVKP